MKIVFVLRSGVSLHSYRDIVRALYRDGAGIRVILDRQWAHITEKEIGQFDALKKEIPGFDYAWAHHRSGFFRNFIFSLRQLASYRRYFFVRQSAFFRERWLGLFPSKLRILASLPGATAIIKSKLFGWLVSFVENRVPPDPAILNQIREYAPDAVIVPVANMRYGAVDMDYLKAAQALGVKTGSPVLSWDTLTTKGLLQIMPDAVLVWNEHQITEAGEHHGVPRDRIRITGAPVFDKWVSLPAASPRSEFCRAHGLREEDPIIVYLGASRNIAVDESHVVKELRSALDRAPDAHMRRAQIILRPHPSNAAIYESLDLHDICVLPRGGSLPDNEASRQLFYDTVFHSIAAVGIYTSGMMDTILVGRPVVALLRPEYRQTQEEAEYFKALAGSGAIFAAHSFGEFLNIARDLEKGNDASAEKREEFIRKNIRPRANEGTASEVMAREIEHLVFGR